MCHQVCQMLKVPECRNSVGRSSFCDADALRLVSHHHTTGLIVRTPDAMATLCTEWDEERRSGVAVASASFSYHDDAYRDGDLF